MERMGYDCRLEYKSSTGAVRKFLYFSECKRFVFIECRYTNEIVLKKWFWSNHRLFK